MTGFDDGEGFSTAGPFVIERYAGGWYVIGDGLLVPVADEAEGHEVIVKLLRLDTGKCHDLDVEIDRLYLALRLARECGFAGMVEAITVRIREAIIPAVALAAMSAPVRDRKHLARRWRRVREMLS
jgi:hypothetical protein